MVSDFLSGIDSIPNSVMLQLIFMAVVFGALYVFLSGKEERK